MKTIHLLLDRIAKKPLYTVGKLYIDGVYFCDTLEDTVRVMHDLNGDGDTKDPGEGKVYGLTALAPGTYKVVMRYSPHFKRWLPWIQNVPSHDLALMHAGNTPKETLGCVLVGKNKVVGGLVESRKTENELIARLETFFEQGFEVFITIK